MSRRAGGAQTRASAMSIMHLSRSASPPRACRAAWLRVVVLAGMIHAVGVMGTPIPLEEARRVLETSPGGRLGQAVAASTFVVIATQPGAADEAVNVFRFADPSWQTAGVTTLRPDDAATNVQSGSRGFGSAAAISEDSSLVVVGSPSEDSSGVEGVGSARVFEADPRLVAGGALFEYTQVGLVRLPIASRSAGMGAAVAVLHTPGGSAALVAAGAPGDLDGQARAVGSVTVAVVRRPLSTGPGPAGPFAVSASTLRRIVWDGTGEFEERRLGSSVALLRVGNTVVLASGAPLAGAGSGAVVIAAVADARTLEVNQTAAVSAVSAHDVSSGQALRFGRALAAHGSTLVVAGNDESRAGAAVPGNGRIWILEVASQTSLSGGAPRGLSVRLRQTLSPASSPAGLSAAGFASFAASVAISELALVVGCPTEQLSGSLQQGVVLVYTNSSETGWVASRRVSHSVEPGGASVAAGARFGLSVAVSDAFLVAGSPFAGASYGRVDVYDSPALFPAAAPVIVPDGGVMWANTSPQVLVRARFLNERVFAAVSPAVPSLAGPFLVGDKPLGRDGLAAGDGGGTLRLPLPARLSLLVELQAVASSAHLGGATGPLASATFNVSVPTPGFRWNSAERHLEPCGSAAVFCPGRFVPEDAVRVSPAHYSAPLVSPPSERWMEAPCEPQFFCEGGERQRCNRTVCYPLIRSATAQAGPGGDPGPGPGDSLTIVFDTPTSTPALPGTLREWLNLSTVTGWASFPGKVHPAPGSPLSQGWDWLWLNHSAVKVQLGSATASTGGARVPLSKLMPAALRLGILPSAGIRRKGNTTQPATQPAEIPVAGSWGRFQPPTLVAAEARPATPRGDATATDTGIGPGQGDSVHIVFSTPPDVSVPVTGLRDLLQLLQAPFLVPEVGIEGAWVLEGCDRYVALTLGSTCHEFLRIRFSAQPRDVTMAEASDLDAALTDDEVASDSSLNGNLSGSAPGRALVRLLPGRLRAVDLELAARTTASEAPLVGTWGATPRGVTLVRFNSTCARIFAAMPPRGQSASPRARLQCQWAAVREPAGRSLRLRWQLQRSHAPNASAIAALAADQLEEAMVQALRYPSWTPAPELSLVSPEEQAEPGFGPEADWQSTLCIQGSEQPSFQRVMGRCRVVGEALARLGRVHAAQGQLNGSSFDSQWNGTAYGAWVKASPKDGLSMAPPAFGPKGSAATTIRFDGRSATDPHMPMRVPLAQSVGVGRFVRAAKIESWLVGADGVRSSAPLRCSVAQLGASMDCLALPGDPLSGRGLEVRARGFGEIWFEDHTCLPSAAPLGVALSRQSVNELLVASQAMAPPERRGRLGCGVCSAPVTVVKPTIVAVVAWAGKSQLMSLMIASLAPPRASSRFGTPDWVTAAAADATSGRFASEARSANGRFLVIGTGLTAAVNISFSLPAWSGGAALREWQKCRVLVTGYALQCNISDVALLARPWVACSTQGCSSGAQASVAPQADPVITRVITAPLTSMARLACWDAAGPVTQALKCLLRNQAAVQSVFATATIPSAPSADQGKDVIQVSGHGLGAEEGSVSLWVSPLRAVQLAAPATRASRRSLACEAVDGDVVLWCISGGVPFAPVLAWQVIKGARTAHASPLFLTTVDRVSPRPGALTAEWLAIPGGHDDIFSSPGTVPGLNTSRNRASHGFLGARTVVPSRLHPLTFVPVENSTTVVTTCSPARPEALEAAVLRLRRFLRTPVSVAESVAAASATLGSRGYPRSESVIGGGGLVGHQGGGLFFLLSPLVASDSTSGLTHVSPASMARLVQGGAQALDGEPSYSTADAEDVAVLRGAADRVTLLPHAVASGRVPAEFVAGQGCAVWEEPVLAVPPAPHWVAFSAADLGVDMAAQTDAKVLLDGVVLPSKFVMWHGSQLLEVFLPGIVGRRRLHVTVGPTVSTGLVLTNAEPRIFGFAEVLWQRSQTAAENASDIVSRQHPLAAGAASWGGAGAWDERFECTRVVILGAGLGASHLLRSRLVDVTVGDSPGIPCEYISNLSSVAVVCCTKQQEGSVRVMVGGRASAPAQLHASASLLRAPVLPGVFPTPSRVSSEGATRVTLTGDGLALPPHCSPAGRVPASLVANSSGPSQAVIVATIDGRHQSSMDAPSKVAGAGPFEACWLARPSSSHLDPSSSWWSVAAGSGAAWAALLPSSSVGDTVRSAYLAGGRSVSATAALAPPALGPAGASWLFASTLPGAFWNRSCRFEEGPPHRHTAPASVGRVLDAQSLDWAQGAGALAFEVPSSPVPSGWAVTGMVDTCGFRGPSLTPVVTLPVLPPSILSVSPDSVPLGGAVITIRGESFGEAAGTVTVVQAERAPFGGAALFPAAARRSLVAAAQASAGSARVDGWQGWHRIGSEAMHAPAEHAVLRSSSTGGDAEALLSDLGDSGLGISSPCTVLRWGHGVVVCVAPPGLSATSQVWLQTAAGTSPAAGTLRYSPPIPCLRNTSFFGEATMVPLPTFWEQLGLGFWAGAMLGLVAAFIPVVVLWFARRRATGGLGSTGRRVAAVPSDALQDDGGGMVSVKTSGASRAARAVQANSLLAATAGDAAVEMLDIAVAEASRRSQPRPSPHGRNRQRLRDRSSPGQRGPMSTAELRAMMRDETHGDDDLAALAEEHGLPSPH